MPLEVIIADDGSGEETRKVIERYKKIFPVPLIHSWIEDKGFRVAKSRNIAIAKAKGAYIVIIDGDIVVTPYFIFDHESIMKKGFFTTGSRARLSKKATKRRIKTLNTRFSFFTIGLSRKFVMLRSPFIHRFLKGREGLAHARSCHMAFWKEDFIKVNGFDESFEGWGHEDSDFIIRLYNNNIKRQNAQALAPAVHLFHKGSENNNLSANYDMLMETMEKHYIKAKKGVDKYL